MTSSFSEQQATFTAVDFDPFAGEEVLLTAPATESQREIWASVQMGKEANCAYNESQSLRLSGALDLQALKMALQELVERHESLRTTFSPDGVNLCITTSPKLETPLLDLSQLTLEARSHQVTERLRQSVEQPFDLEHGPLFRVEILKLQPQEHLILLTAHHIICDGWSWGVLVPDFGKLYSTLKQGKLPDLEPPDRFSDYALTLESETDSEEAIATENFWLQQFSSSVPVVDFPTDHPRLPLRTFNSARCDYQLSSTLVSVLKQLSTEHNCSFMTTLLASFEVFLTRLTGQSDLVVGISAAGQAATGRYNLVGHCVNLLPLRTQVDSEQPFSNYLKVRKSTVLDAYDHQQFTFGRLVQKLSIPRDPSRIPLVPIVFNVEQGLDDNKLPFDSLEVEFLSNSRSFENFELYLNATELSGKLTLECQYNTNLFNRETIQRHLVEFEALLTGISNNPNELIANLPILPEMERQLLENWNRTHVPYPQSLCLHQLVEAQVERTPDEIAIVFQEQQLTYRELNQRADQLAAYLRQLGIKPETLVGICVERSIEMVVGLLGILKAGGAYVPIDPNYPTERIAFLLHDSQVNILLTQTHLKATLPAHMATTICLDSDWAAIAATAISFEESDVHSDHLAYVIYTSGSTGNPKGAMNTHRGVCNRLLWMQEKYKLDGSDSVLQKTPFSFDVSVWEFFWTLMTGARLVIVEPESHRDSYYLTDIIAKQTITTIHFVPSMLQTFLDTLTANQCTTLKRVICSGEALPLELKNRFFEKINCELHNLYGPTEAAIDVTFWQCHQDDPLQTVPIGYPIANTQIHILDKHLQPVPIGVSGELHIGGVGVARGYLRRPELTAEKFIADPSLSGSATLYKTGDLARFLPDGAIEYLGRIDYQVKVRGFRIELGEIETTLLQHSALKEAVVIAREDNLGEKILVGYFVPQPGIDSNLLIPELRRFLKERLPEYMVPTIFTSLEIMPLTPNGKVDRGALPKPDSFRPELAAQYVAPRTLIERRVTEIWAQVLKLERVGIHDNFFEMGGYSLLAIQSTSRIRQAFQVEILLSNIFELPTVAELADRIETLLWITQENHEAPGEMVGYEEGEL